MAANIFLIGFMGTGKTTISRQLVHSLNFVETDMDQEIEKQENRKISEIFASNGEAYFRDLETALIKKYEKRNGLVISCGGGTVLRQENVKSMKKSGVVVWLTATPQTVYDRVRCSKSRPLLNGNMNVPYIAEMMEKRREIYAAAADVAVATDHRLPREISEEIIKKIKNLKNLNFSFDF